MALEKTEYDVDLFLQELKKLMDIHGMYINVSLNGDTHGLLTNTQVVTNDRHGTVLATIGYDQSYLDSGSIRDYFRDKEEQG